MPKLKNIIRTGSKILSKTPDPIDIAENIKKTFQDTGLTGIALRNRKNLFKLGKDTFKTARKKGIKKAASTAAKGALKIAAGKDPRTHIATSKLLGPAATNVARRLGKDAKLTLLGPATGGKKEKKGKK